LTVDILLSTPYQCGDNDCTSPGTWHKGTFWIDDSEPTGYTYDEFSDGDHEPAEESDLPSAEKEVLAWATYRVWALDNQLDPLGEFMYGVPGLDSDEGRTMRDEWQRARELAGEVLP
jgi:hypothetical protein